MLNGESADVPEYIVVDWLLRYLRCAMAIGTPESHFQCGRHCYALPYVCVPDCYIGPNSQEGFYCSTTYLFIYFS